MFRISFIIFHIYRVAIKFNQKTSTLKWQTFLKLFVLIKFLMEGQFEFNLIELILGTIKYRWMSFFLLCTKRTNFGWSEVKITFAFLSEQDLLNDLAKKSQRRCRP